MAKRKARNSGEGPFTITQLTLDQKGKTNKKLNRRPRKSLQRKL